MMKQTGWIGLILFISISNVTLGLLCYSCNSTTYDGCSDPDTFNATNIPVKICHDSSFCFRTTMGVEENQTVYIRDCAMGDQCTNDEYSSKKRRRRRRRRELEEADVISFSYDYCCKRSKCNGSDMDTWWAFFWNNL